MHPDTQAACCAAPACSCMAAPPSRAIKPERMPARQRAPAAASRPQWAPWAAGQPPQSWAAVRPSSRQQPRAGRAAGTGPAGAAKCVGRICARTWGGAAAPSVALCGLKAAMPAREQAAPRLQSGSSTWDQDPGAAHRSTTCRTPAGRGGRDSRVTGFKRAVVACACTVAWFHASIPPAVAAQRAGRGRLVRPCW